MVALKRLWIEQARLGYKFPTTIEEVEASEKESNGIPNTCPVGCVLDGEAGIFALHNFSDGDTWLVRLADHSDNWVTQRVATDADKRTIKALYPDILKLSEEDSDSSPDVGDFLVGRDGALLCFCGDPRIDHPNDGPCNLNGLGHGIPSSEPESKCLAYHANKGND